MTPGIDKDGFDRQIEITYQKLDGLLRRMSISGQETTVASEALEELSTTLEELHVVSDELSRQNTELAAAHLVAQAERQRYQDLFDFAPDGYLVTDTNGVIREANRAAADLLHVAQELLVGKPLAVYVAENERKAFRDILSTLLKRSISGANEWEITLRPRGGLEVKVSITVTPVVPVSTSPLPALGLGIAGVGLRWSLRDITESRRAAERERLLEELRQANRLLQTLLETMPVGVTVCDPDGSIRMLNPTGRKILGGTVTGSARSPEKNFELLHPDGSLVLAEHFPMVRALEAKELTDNEEFIVRRADGSELTVMSSAAPVLGAGGELLGGVTIFQDHSGRKRAEEQVASLAKFPSEDPNPVLRVGGKGILLYANPASQMLLDEWQTAVDQPLPEFWQTILAGVENEKQQVEVNASVRVFSFTVSPVPGTDYTNLYGLDITARKQAEDALHESELKYRSLVKYAPAGIYEVDFRTGRFTEVNDVMCEILGYTRAELLGMPAVNILDEEGIATFGARIRLAESGDQPSPAAEYRVRTKDDRLIWSLLNITFHRQGDRITSATVIANDITDRKLAEKALEDSQRSLQAVFNGVTETIMVMDLDGKILNANQTAARRWGTTVSSLIGKNGFGLTPPETQKKRKEQIRQLAETGLPVRFQDERADAIFDLTFYPIKDAHEKISQFVVFAQDITDRKLAEQALQESERRFRSVLDNSRDVIYRLNVQTGRYEYISPSAEKVIGFSPEELMAQEVETALAMIHPDDLPAVKAAHARLEQEGESDVEYRQRTTSGEYRWLSNHLSLIRDAAGCPLYRSGNLRDITGRKQTEEERVRLLEEVEKRVAELDATISSMAIGLIVYNLDGKAIRMNEKAKQLLPAEVFFNNTVEERARLIRWETETGAPFPTEAIPVARAQRGETTLNVVLAAAFPDHKLWISASAAPIQTPDGKTLGVVASFIDITKEKESEQALQESETRLRRFYESGLLGVIYWNMAGEITDANDKFLEMTGFTRADLNSGSIDWARMTPPEYQHLDEVSMAELKATGINASPFEKEYLRKDGTRLPILLAGAMLDEARTNGVAFILDITESKLADQKLRANNDELKRFNMAMVGRELRMVNLKNEVNQLCKQAGLPPRYGKDAGRKKPDDE